MTITLRSLLASQDFTLRLLSSPSAVNLDRHVTWAHSTDLEDPTPWLGRDQLLLTNGSQIPPDGEQTLVDEYCHRLKQLDIAGVGFATHVIHSSVPAALQEAAARHDLALIEVADRTPFIGIIRHVADDVASDRNARLSWSLEAQRAVARAASREDGLREILRTLSHRLRTWVALYDAAGALVAIPGLETVPADLADVISDEVRALLVRGTPAALRTLPPAAATLQTIGQRGRLRGVLAVAAPAPLDAAETDLVGSVIALAGIALEQQRALDASRRRLRSGVLELLIAGQTAQASRTAQAVWGSLPDPPFLLCVVGRPIPGQSLLDELEIGAAGAGMFFAERENELVILLAPDGMAQLEPIATRHQLPIGVVLVRRWEDLELALRQGKVAGGASTLAGFSRYEDIVAQGMLGALRASGGHVLSRAVLSPVDELPFDEAQKLRESALVWLEANGAWDPASRRLGIHRHTLRARIDQLGDLLNLNLDTFSGRAELWAALELRDEE